MLLLVHPAVRFSIELAVEDFSIVRSAPDFVWQSVLFLKSFTGTYYSTYQDQTRYL